MTNNSYNGIEIKPGIQRIQVRALASGATSLVSITFWGSLYILYCPQALRHTAWGWMRACSANCARVVGLRSELPQSSRCSWPSQWESLCSGSTHEDYTWRTDRHTQSKGNRTSHQNHYMSPGPHHLASSASVEVRTLLCFVHTLSVLHLSPSAAKFLCSEGRIRAQIRD